MTKENHVIDLIPAYTLDCLEEEEAALVAEHLTGCADCRAELRAYQQVAQQLAYAAPQVEPPSRVKSELMAHIVSSARAKQDKGVDSASWVERIRQGLFSIATSRLSPAWGVVSLVLILVLAASNVLLWRQVNQLRANQQPARMEVVALQGTEFVPQATGLIVISQDGQHGTLVVDDLPALDESHEYQLWLIRDGERTSGAVFSVSEDGYSNKWIGAPEPLTSYSSFGVTIEPAGGSPGPTGEKVLGGEF